MAYLVRVSSREIINLPEGENSIGRCPLLKVTDKRVSRNHALLRLSSGSLSLCPKHATNSCFHKAVDQTTYVRLEKDQWKDLKDGECFSLLPAGELAFKVVDESHENGASNTPPAVPAALLPSEPVNDPQTPPRPSSGPSTTSHAQSPTSHQVSSAPASDSVEDLLFGNAPLQPDAKDAGNGVETNSKSTCQETRVVGEQSTPEDACGDEENRSSAGDQVVAKDAGSDDEDVGNGRDGKEAPVSDTKVAGSTNKRRVLPTWLASYGGAGGGGGGGKGGATKRRDPPRKPPKKQVSKKSHSPASTPSPVPPPTKKPAHKGVAVKKNPTNPTAEAKADTRSTSQSENPAAADVSDEESGPSTSRNQATNQATEKKRPLCPYGTACYRRNPAHFRDYSHDFAAADDSDGSEPEVDTRPDCPFGGSCYRKNPDHHLEFAHPALAARQGTRQATRQATTRQSTTTRHSTRVTRARKEGEKKSVLVEDSDDDGQPNTYDCTDSFIDDQTVKSSSSAYASDDSDWVPGGDKEEEGMEEDDVMELVADADDFIKNKKMRR